MRRIKFVTQIKEGKLKLPARFNESLEGLDLLVTVEPVVVEREKTIMEELWGEKKIKDFNPSLNPCAPSGLHPAITQEELNDLKKTLKEDEVYDYNGYLDNARHKLDIWEPVDTVTISRKDGILLNFGYKDGVTHHTAKIADKHELRNVLGSADYADSFKLTIKSAPLYEELTSVVYHFFLPKYRLTDTSVNLDDYTDTYEKDKDYEKRLKVDKDMLEKLKKIAKGDFPIDKEKEKQWQLYEEKKLEEAVVRGELKPVYEDGKIRYEKNDDKELLRM